MNYKVLIVEDEAKLREILCDYFKSKGELPFEASNGMQALSLIEENDYDAVLLDIMMPGLDGLSVCRSIRKTNDVPIIFLTALSDEEDKLLGYELGADDYITKPYTVRNVIARVKSVLRRTSHKKSHILAEKPNVLKAEGLRLDLEIKRCTVDGEEVKLTRKEYELLAYLISHRGQICSREQILSRVWSDEVVVLERTIDVNITRLRSKIGAYGSYIVTRSGFGYGFRD